MVHHHSLICSGWFLHHTKLVKKQANVFFGHPLFFKFICIASLEYAHLTLAYALQWTKHIKIANGNPDDVDKVLAVTNMSSVTVYGGSTLGNVHLSISLIS